MLYDDLELLKTRELLSLPPACWLMQDVIPEEGFVGIYGAPSSGKSFIALDWAMSISEGMSWLGEFPTKQAPVVYVAAEGGRGIQGRVRAWMRHRQKRDLTAMYWLLSPLYVREEGTVERFLDTLEQRDVWPGLLVLDTLSRSFGGGEENASQDMGHFVDQMTRLAQGRRMAVLVVHHKNATGLRERGHTSFRGAADAMFGCKAERDAVGRITSVELTNDKQKDALEIPPIHLAPVPSAPETLIFQRIPTPEKKRGPGPGGPPPPMRTQDMLRVLSSADEGMTWREWRLAVGIDRNRFNKRLRKLTQENEIFKEGGRYYVMPAVADLADTDTDTDEEQEG